MAISIVGLFEQPETAQAAVRDLIEAGFSRKDISVVAADPEGELYRRHVNEEGTISGEGAATGATSGAVVGGILGLLIGVGLIFVPAGVIVAGPVAGLIAGGAAGAATGGLVGGLIGLGVPKEEADVYAEGIQRGEILVSVQAEEKDVAKAHQILDREGALEVDEKPAEVAPEPVVPREPEAYLFEQEETAIQPTSFWGADRAFPSDPIRSRVRRYHADAIPYADNPPYEEQEGTQAKDEDSKG